MLKECPPPHADVAQTVERTACSTVLQMFDGAAASRGFDSRRPHQTMASHAIVTHPPRHNAGFCMGPGRCRPLGLLTILSPGCAAQIFCKAVLCSGMQTGKQPDIPVALSGREGSSPSHYTSGASKSAPDTGCGAPVSQLHSPGCRADPGNMRQ